MWGECVKRRVCGAGEFEINMGDKCCRGERMGGNVEGENSCLAAAVTSPDLPS